MGCLQRERRPFPACPLLPLSCHGLARGGWSRRRLRLLVGRPCALHRMHDKATKEPAFSHCGQRRDGDKKKISAERFFEFVAVCLPASRKRTGETV